MNVTAVDSFKSLTVAGGVAGGFVGVAGGIDIGIANSSVTAYIGNGSFVSAANNVDVNALSRKDVSTYAVSVGGGFVGVAGSVSVWSIGTQATTTYHDAPAGPNKGTWTAGVIYAKGDVVTDSFDGKTYAAKGPGDTTPPSTSLAPHANLAEWEGPTDSLAPTPSTDDGRFKGTWTEGTGYAINLPNPNDATKGLFSRSIPAQHPKRPDQYVVAADLVQGMGAALYDPDTYVAQGDVYLTGRV